MDSSTYDDHPLVNGKRSAASLLSVPTIPSLPNPYGGDKVTLFQDGFALTSYDNEKLKPLISAFTDTSPAEKNAIAGIYDDRIVALDPYSFISILGHMHHDDNSIQNYGEFHHGYPYFYGLNRDYKKSYKDHVEYNEAGLQLLYNAIIYLAGGKKEEISSGVPSTPSTPAPTVIITPNPDIVTWTEYSTPYVRSWITTNGSISTSELNNEPSLSIINGKLMRKLFKGSPQNILQSYISTHNNINFLSFGDCEAEVIVDNPNVIIYQDGDNYYTYTETAGGIPFEAGTAYPSNWIRSDHWLSRKKLLGGTLDTDLLGKTRTEVTSTYADKEWKAVPTKGTRTVSVPGTPTYPTRSASWHISTMAPGAAQEVAWTATGVELGSGTTEVKKIVSGNATFTIKSKELEASRSTAYAWVYIPQSDKVLRQGSTGADVSFWQKALSDLGYYSATVDGDYGSKTYAAVKKFQSDHNEILEDGIIGPETGGRIADACALAQKFLPNHYQYVSSNNLLDSSSGTYGRRTNPFGLVYSTSSLQDYIQVDFATAVSIKRLTLKACPGPATGKSWKVTRVTAWAGATRVVDISPNQTMTPGVETGIPFASEVAGIDKLYVHIESSQYYMRDTSNAYYWGLVHLQAFGSGSTSETVTGDAARTGTVSLQPGQAQVITLPSTGFRWDDVSVTGDATVVILDPAYTDRWTITDTRSGGSVSSNGATDSTTLTGLDGVQTFSPLLPDGATGDQTATLVSTHDSSTVVEFYNGSGFVGSSTQVSNLQGAGYSVGVQVHESAPFGDTTTEEYYYDVYQWIDVIKTRTDFIDNVASTGHIKIEGTDPPPAYFAYKAYAVKQHDGRLNVNLYPPDKNLTPVDPWYPKVSFGEFTKAITLGSNSVGWMGKYPGTVIKAVYSIPHHAWSDAGVYTLKIENEVLNFAGPRTVKTKRSPLLFNSANDGITTLVLNKNGTPLTDVDITDVSKDGTITLAANILSSDIITGTYYVRVTTKDITGLNLNPYPGHTLVVDGRTYDTYQKIGLPVYVYLLPSFCRTELGVIPESIETNVLQYTTRTETFDTSSDYYNELAVLLGVVACTGYVHPEDVVLLDARSYGGGTESDVTESLFDIDYYDAKTYPEHGFVIIDIAKEDKSKADVIKEAIEKNIAAGTIYQIRWV